MTGRIFRPFTVGIFSIIPSGEPLPEMCGIPVILGRKGAFGSGEHETTASCLELLPQVPGIASSRALDLGAGTGVLSIAAARLGAAVTAIDLEWPAALSCHENVRLNHLQDSICTICGESGCLSGIPYDLIMANIYADILLDQSERLVSLTRQGGFILLSGIPLQDKFDVVNRYSSLGCSITDSRIGDEYATYLLRKTVCG